VLALLVLIAISDVRFGTHVGGGFEGGTILEEATPDALAEAGVFVDFIPPGWRMGFGIVWEKVKRRTSSEPIETETKVDVMVRVADKNRRIVGGFGAGIRRLDIEGESRMLGQQGATERLPSKVWGIDLMRMDLEVPFVRLTGKVGYLSMGLYFAWTFGMYRGEINETRIGDMPYPKRDYSPLSSSYVAGIQTSLAWR